MTRYFDINITIEKLGIEFLRICSIEFHNSVAKIFLMWSQKFNKATSYTL